MDAGHAAGRPRPYAIAALAHPAGSPVHLVVPGRDPLRDHSLALARTLQAEGRAVTVDLHSSEPHGFLQRPQAVPAAARALAGIACWIRTLDTQKPLFPASSEPGRTESGNGQLIENEKRFFDP